MKATFGNKFRLTVFGESHGAAIGVVIDGVPSGLSLNMSEIDADMSRRSSKGKDGIATARKEEDKYEIVSGFFNGATTGTPLTAIIRNTDTRSKDYSATSSLMRPGHSDYGYYIKSGGYNDYRGGGHSSGRLTAPMVFAGVVAKQILAQKGIKVGAHILSVGDVYDSAFDCVNPDFNSVGDNEVIDGGAWVKMRRVIEDAAKEGDSVGGRIECAITGVSAGLGDPLFDSIESVISHIMFSVPAVKGIQFGKGYAMTSLRGSEVNDPFYYDNGVVKTSKNDNGGVLGGISTGMPIIFDVAIKPTASIFKEQDTVDVKEKRNAKITVHGRHDPCIVPRAVPVIEAAAAIAVCDIVM